MSNTAASQFTNNNNVHVILPDVPLCTQYKRYSVKRMKGALVIDSVGF